MTTTSDFARQCLAAARLLLALTLVLGVAYPLAVWGGAALLPGASAAAPVTSGGTVVGSRLIGQTFTGEQWFHSRPSVAGKDGYDTLASAGSNLGPENTDLLATVEERRTAVAAEEGVDPADVPPDALTASASGLDPDISPAYAQLQVARVARENGLSAEQVKALVDDQTVGRTWGFLGEAHVNVLALNVALRELASRA